jgi:hypothetical protein
MIVDVDSADEDDSTRCDLLKQSGCCYRAAAKFADLLDEKVEGSRPDNKIQSSRSPRSAPIDEGLTRQMS